MFVGLFQLGRGDCAIVRTPADSLEKALDPFGVADKSGRVECDQARLYQALTFNTAESKRESVPTVCPNTGRIIIAWVRLDNRYELAKKLNIDAVRLQDVTDPELILDSYERWGASCVEHLIGDFSFCIYDSARKTVYAARDPMGVKPLFYHCRGGVLVVSSGARVFPVIEGLSLVPREEWLAQYAIGISTSFTDTCWADIYKLEPGHFLEMRAGAPMSISKYFTWLDNPPDSIAREEERVEAYRSVLEESVKCRLRTAYPLGCEISGGLDSSTIIGFAATHWQSDKDLHTFGHAYCDLEPGYILQTSQWHGIACNHIATGFRFRQADEGLLERTFSVLGYPEEHSAASSYDFFYSDCNRYDVRTLLSGFGGDEVVTNTGHLLLKELADNNHYLTLWENLPGSLAGRTARLIKQLYTNRKGVVARSNFASAFAARWSGYVLRDEIENRYSLKERTDEFAVYDSVFRRINDFILKDRLAPYVTTRFENGSLMAASRGVEYRWPLMDVRLIQQYLSTPSIEKYGNGNSRYLHRRAVEGIVPPSVQWKKNKNMGGSERALSIDNEGSSVALAELLVQLRDELHPALEPVVDVSRLMAQRDRLQKERREDHPSRWLGMAKHYQSLQVLNKWLVDCS